MISRRDVRVTEAFFEELDAQLGSEREPSGEPSATDFLVIDLPAVVERFASGFDELPEAVGGIKSARMFIGSSALVRALFMGSRRQKVSLNSSAYSSTVVGDEEQHQAIAGAVGSASAITLPPRAIVNRCPPCAAASGKR